MICIDDEALDLIAGGCEWYLGPISSCPHNPYDPPPPFAEDIPPDHQDPMPVVSVPGSPPVEPEEWWPPLPGHGSGSMPVSTPVSTPSDDPGTAPCDHHSSPVPASHPLNVDMDALRNTAIRIANQIKQLDPNIEHGALIFRTADGSLRVGEIKHGTEGRVQLDFIPDRTEVLVGYIHSHPIYNGVDQKRPSIDDLAQASELRPKIYADSNLLLYVLDNESGHVFEYSKDSDGKKVGANISTDTCNG